MSWIDGTGKRGPLAIVNRRAMRYLPSSAIPFQDKVANLCKTKRSILALPDVSFTIRKLRDGESKINELGSDPKEALSDSAGQSGNAQSLSQLRSLTRRVLENSPSGIGPARQEVWMVSRMLPTTPKGPCIRVRTRAGTDIPAIAATNRFFDKS